MTPTSVSPVPHPTAAVVTRVDDPKVADDATWHIGSDVGCDLGWDIVDLWGEQSFPASDPPANW